MLFLDTGEIQQMLPIYQPSSSTGVTLGRARPSLTNLVLPTSSAAAVVQLAATGVADDAAPVKDVSSAPPEPVLLVPSLVGVSSDSLCETVVRGRRTSFRCTQCAYTSKTRSNVVTHAKLHTGEKNFKVLVCGGLQIAIGS